jgi:hypothetical protein
VVRHAVVHLTGDPGPLHRRGQGAGLVVFAFEPLGPIAQLGQVGPASVRVQARNHDRGGRDDLVDHGQPAVMPAALAGRGDLGRQRERGRDECRVPAQRGRDRVEGDSQRDRDQLAADRPLGQYRGHEDHDAEHRAGPDPPQ